MFELLFGFGQAVMRLIEAAQCQLSIHGLGINVGCFFEIVLSLVGKVGAQLKQGHQQVGLGAVAVEFYSLVHLLQGSGNIVLRSVVVGPGLMGFRGVGQFLAENVEMSLRLLEIFRHRAAVRVPHRDQEVRHVGVGTVVRRIEFNGAVQFLEGAVGIAEFEVGLRELGMRLGEAGIDLNGIGVLNGRFAVLARSEVFFAAIEIFLLADVGITGAACKRHGHQSTSQQQTDRNGATHIGFSNCGYREHTSTLIRTQPP